MSVPFDEPGAWGFCIYCAFEVAVDLETGQMLAHQRRAGDWEYTRCYGSLLEPEPTPDPPEAVPVKWDEEARNNDAD